MRKVFLLRSILRSEAVLQLKSNYAVNQLNESNSYEISFSGPNKELNSHILKGIVTGIQQNNIVEKQTDIPNGDRLYRCENSRA